MAVLNFISKTGGVMPLFENPYFTLEDVDGLTQFDASLSSVVVPGVDGDTVSNAQAQPRVINLYLRVRSGVVVEEAKNHILKYVKPMQTGTLHFENHGRRVKITGLCYGVSMPRFGKGITMLVALHCERPFWSDAEEIVQQIGFVLNKHYFPPAGLAFPVSGIPFGMYDYNRTQAFTNAGDVPVGLDIQIVALATVTNPTLYDLASGAFMKINDTLQEGDVVHITTHKGNKTIVKNEENIIDKLTIDSSWLVMPTGDSEFMIDSDDEARNNVYFSLKYRQLYI